MSWLYTIIFAGLSFSSGEAAVPMPVDLPQTDTVVVDYRKGDETERFEQTYPLNPNGRVSVSNVNGSITVEAWDKNEAKLVAIKTADSKEMLGEVEIKVESKPDYLSVETDYDSSKSRSGDRWRNRGRLEVEYQLWLPRGAVLSEIETVNGSVDVSNFTNIVKISAVNGTVKANNIRGTAKLSTVNGEVYADFDRLESGSKISLETVNGRVNLVLPSDSNATLKADSLNGNITNDFGLPVRKGKYIGRDLYGRIGSGDTQIKLNSVNGNLAISRRNDGKNLNPSTNLLNQKNNEDWDDMDQEELAAKAEKLDKEKVRAAPKAPRAPKPGEMVDVARLNAEVAKLSAESVARTADVLNSAEIQKKIRQEAVIAQAADAIFSRGVPRVQTQTGNFVVKGVPTVTVVAEPCAVRVKGWDKNEVQYRVVQMIEPRRGEPLKVSQSQSDSNVSITLDEPKENNGLRFYGDGQRTVIEVFVPRKSNLNITANEGIRVEGVTGTIKLVGVEDTINVIDGEGSLKVKTSDGPVRVIGFRGDVDAESGDGSINLEGEFSRLNVRSSDGAVNLTLPEDAAADLVANCEEIRGDGIPVIRVGGDENQFKYRIGRGGAPFQIKTDGKITIRGASSLADIY